MISTEYFLITPTNQLGAFLADAGEELLDEFVKPSIWAQGFDLRATGSPSAKLLIESAVKLRYLAYAASQLKLAFENRFEQFTPDVFDQFWTINWIEGGMTEGDEIYSDINGTVAAKMSIGSLADESQLSGLLNESLEKLRNRIAQS